MKRIFTVIIGLALIAPPLAGKSGADVKKEISSNTRSLREVQRSIKEKRLEKEKYLLDEKRARREIGRIEAERVKLQKKGELLRREVRKAEKNLATAAREMKLAGAEERQWSSAMERDANLWFRAHHSYCRLYCDPVDEQMRMRALFRKNELRSDAKEKEEQWKRSIDKWKKAQARLVDLRKQHVSNVARQEELKAEKQEFLKTTIGRRVLAEEEIGRLVESAKALEQLLKNLEREKKKTDEEALARKKFKGRKKYLPWPVEGQVVVNFGKSKHPELDTYLISNGIKIRTTGGAAVRAVARGEVMFCGEFRSYGQMIILDHGGGFYSIYGQVGEIAVDEGQRVSEGDVVGRVSGPGQPVLYFEVRSDNQPEDPMLWLK